MSALLLPEEFRAEEKNKKKTTMSSFQSGLNVLGLGGGAAAAASDNDDDNEGDDDDAQVILGEVIILDDMMKHPRRSASLCTDTAVRGKVSQGLA